MKGAVAMELYATIRKSSKYARQGTDATGQAIFFPVDALQDDCCGYLFRLNSNQYRQSDLHFWVKTPGGKLVKLNPKG